MAQPPRKRRTYWITDAVTPVLRDRALLLNQKGYDVHFFTSLDALTHELINKRAGVIVVSDDGDEAMTERILMTLMGLPEVQGARMVMVRSRTSERISFLAACANFRDIIPSQLDERLWLTRFIFATGGRPLQYVQPAGQITLNNISAVALPARLVRLGEELLTVECRVRPPAGATLNLAGPLADLAGVPHIGLKVVETRRSHLLHRFSDAVVARWSVPAEARPRMLEAVAEVRQSDPGPRCRIFVAVQAADLRSQILTRFDDPRFEVSTALQKQSIAQEPKFFTPDLVLIEESLLAEDDGARFDEMLRSLTPQAAVVVLGLSPSFTALKEKYPGRTLIQLQRIPKNLTQSVLARFLPESLGGQGRPAPKSDPSGAHVIAEHPCSFAEVTFPARLHRLHPLAAKIAMPFPVNNFALCRIDSPLLNKMLGRSPYAKLTTTYQDTHPDAPPFVHVADCYLADLDQGERRLMVQRLTRLFAESMGRLDPSGSFGAVLEAGGAGEARTPELGSLRPAPAAGGGERAARATPVGRPPESHGNAAVAFHGSAAAALGPAPAEADERLLPAEELADLIKPVVKPLTQVADGLAEAAQAGQEALQRARARATAGGGKKRKKGVATAHVPPRQIALAFIFVCFIVALLWALFTGLAGTMDRSGSDYSDQLMKFKQTVNP